ncbi:Uncharacterized conserved protein YqhQ [Lachnospiraceae bacterium]|nr:Uncharacterized conserved protein YqhQ [Lachnospiraceae bacterium]
MSKKDCCNAKYSGIGGQAVMEGVMMRNEDRYAVAVRRPDGKIEVMQDRFEGIIPVKAVYKIPFIRGIFSFLDSLVLGMKSLNYSVDFYTEDEDTLKKRDSGEKKSAGDSILSVVIMILAVMMAMGLFMVIPFFASQLFKKWITEPHLLALIEGLIRMLIFLLYITAISGMEDIKRVFRYHGAEHKCINCLENGNPLTVENVRAASRQHRRCGTSFLLYVMVVSILLFAVIQTPDRLTKVVLRIVLIPVIAGIAYELIRLAGKSNNPLVRAMSVPGLLLQKLTTAEPDDSMIEIGIASVEAVYDWKKYLKENFNKTDEELENIVCKEVEA